MNPPLISFYLAYYKKTKEVQAVVDINGETSMLTLIQLKELSDLFLRCLKKAIDLQNGTITIEDVKNSDDIRSWN